MLQGFKRNFKPLEILTDEQLEAIHRGTLDILETTGIVVEHDRALKLFADHGCKVDFGKNRVRIPGWLVEDSLRKCPSSFPLRARVVAVVPSSKVFSSTGIVTLDFHIRITEVYFYNIAFVILDIDRKLLRTTRCTKRIVQSNFLTLIFCCFVNQLFIH